MTPRQFYALRRQHRMKVEHQELLNGIVAATIANYAFGGARKAKSPEEFMPTKWRALHSDDTTVAKVKRTRKAKVKDTWTDKDREELGTSISTMMKVMAASRSYVVVTPNPAATKEESKENNG